MKLSRSSGVLLHISSLPGNYGSGTLGPEAYDFTEKLVKGGFSLWQTLPVGPVHEAYHYSPYSSSSTFAGNSLFISPEKYADLKWFPDPGTMKVFPDSNIIDYKTVINHRKEFLKEACSNFLIRADEDEISDFNKFCSIESYWLDDYAMFNLFSEIYGTARWLDWEEKAKQRDFQFIKKISASHASELNYEKFVQYLFFKQWHELKTHCGNLGIKLIGDIPIYVTLDSSDAWSHPDIFQLNRETGEPDALSGVPPDYFSETGQRWGNPLYRWFNDSNELFEPTMIWWVKRLKHQTDLYDYLRIDHFRGFESFWSIPAEEKTAVNGKWVPGPGLAFFEYIRESLGDLPLIAEDLGVITRDVEKLRDELNLPGMKILQFAFDFNNKNCYLPHNITNHRCFLYTGTHDNNTINGWFYGPEINEDTRNYILEYLGSCSYNDFHWQLIRLAFSTVADCVIIPAQDLLGYGTEFRMNRPGIAEGNWKWKLTREALSDEILKRLYRMTEIYSRLNERNGNKENQSF